MDLIVTAVAAAFAGGLAGWMFGQGAGRRTFEEALARLTRRLQEGEVADVGAAPEPVQAVARVVEAHWAPAKPGSAESATTDLNQAALWEALQRVSTHLSASVRSPLAEASSGDATQLREGVGEALGALEDIEFFLAATPEGRAEIDLGDAVQEVLREFSAEGGVRPKQRGPRRPIQVTGNSEALQDALFLILHNANQFGRGRAIDVVVRVEDGHGRVHVRDRGAGFSAEALSRAYDPFYTTVDGNLGLGLAHARKLIEDSGGKIHLRNSERGGGEVEIGLPLIN